MTERQLKSCRDPVIGAEDADSVIIECLREISFNPRNLEVYLRLGNILHSMERYPEAVSIYDMAIAANPDFGEAYHNRGNSLLELGRNEEAISSYRDAIRTIPSFAEGYVTTATALQALRRPYEAMASCYRALAIDPGCAEAHWNLGLALLQTGVYEQGWEEFEWRWKKRGYTTRPRYFQQPLWDGNPLGGRTILIHAEQGFGDTFQFARFLPEVAALGGRVLLECPAPLVELMKGVQGVSMVIGAGGRLPPFDLHLPVMSLPRALKVRVDSIPGKAPYLFSSPEKLAAWKVKLNGTGTFRVGIVWAGRKKPDPNRTCPLRFIEPVSLIPGITMYSLQVGEITKEDENVKRCMGLVDLTAELKDFSDTAALISLLDLVISIDTGVVHLSGALGGKTWAILPYAADWRWMLDRNDSPWYPTMRLFRQERPGDWPGVINQVARELRAILTHSTG